MTKRLLPNGSSEHVANVAKVGKGKTPQSLAARMPSAELVTKAGTNWMYQGERNRQLIRLNARG